MILNFNLSIMPAMAHFGCVSYKEPWIHFKRLTDEYLLYFIKNGELHMEENGIRYTLKRGDFFLLQPGLIHSGFNRHAAIISIYISNTGVFVRLINLPMRFCRI
ncbi:MAG: AraC family ligand binding domain-containing protein [Clostridia bacterium]